jgi:photosystem II stability/assembly factor-like uncharacterized protein
MGTTDGSAHWAVLRKDDGRNAPDLEGLSFVDARQGWAVGGRGPTDRYMILATIDGGLDWTEQLSRKAAHQCAGGLSDVCFVDLDHGWAVGNSVILATPDGGQHWTRQQTPPDIVFYSVLTRERIRQVESRTLAKLGSDRDALSLRECLD